ncbi:unnamed protein product [Brassica rapa subsp. trilocularis]
MSPRKKRTAKGKDKGKYLACFHLMTQTEEGGIKLSLNQKLCFIKEKQSIFTITPHVHK